MYKGLLGKIANLIRLKAVTCKDASADGRLQMKQGSHQRGFTGTVFAYNAEIIACIYTEVQIAYDSLACVTQGKILTN